MDLLNYIDSPDDQGGGYDFQNDPQMLAADEKMRREMERRQQTLKMLGIPGEQSPGVRNALQMLAQKIQQPAMPPIPMKPEQATPQEDAQQPQPPQPTPYRQLGDAMIPDLRNQLSSVLQSPQQKAQVNDYGGMTTTGALSPESVQRQIAAQRVHDENNPIDNLVAGALSPALKNPYYYRNVALAHEVGGDPNKLIDENGDIHLSKGQKASTILNSIMRGLVEGPRYKPLQDRLAEQAKLIQDSQESAARTLQANQKNQYNEARLAEMQRQNDARNALALRHGLVTEAIGKAKFDQGQYDKDFAQEVAKTRLLTNYEAEMQHWDKQTTDQVFKQRAIDLAEKKSQDKTAGGWDGMARQLAFEEFQQQYPGVDPKAKPDEFKKLYLDNVKQIAGAKHIATDPTRYIKINDRFDDAGNPVVTVLPYNQREGIGKPIQVAGTGKSAKQVADLKPLDEAVETASRVLGTVSELGISGKADQIMGAVDGNDLVAKLRNQLGVYSINENDLDLGTFKENLTNAKLYSSRVTNFEIQQVRKALPQKIDNWHTAVRAQALVSIYNNFAAFRAHSGITTHEAEDALTHELKLAASGYVEEVEKRHDQYMKAKKVNPNTPPPPVPKIATPNQILANLAKDGYVIKNGSLVYVGKDKAAQPQEGND